MGWVYLLQPVSVQGVALDKRSGGQTDKEPTMNDPTTLRNEERAAIVAWLRDVDTTMQVTAPWQERSANGVLTGKSQENVGIAFMHATRLATAIERGEHLAPTDIAEEKE